MTTTRLFLLVLFALVSMPPGEAAAQESADEPAADAPAAPTLSEIVNLVQEHGANLLAVESRLEPDPDIEKIVESVQEAVATRADLEARVTAALEKRASIFRLRTLREEADLLRREFEDWGGKLDSEFDDRSRDLEAVKAGWTAIDAAIEQVADLPEALVSEINSMRERTDGIEPNLTEQLNWLVEGQGRASREKAEVVALIGRLDAAMDQDTQELFGRDAPRLWRAWSTATPDEGLDLSYADVLGEFGAYATEQRDLIIAHALFVVALAVMFTILQRSARKGEEVDAGLSGAADALGNPLSAAVMLGFLPTYWIHSLGPRDLIVVSYLLISVPLVHLLNKHFPAVLRPAARALVAAVVVYFLVELLTEELSLAYRLGLLPVAGVGAVAFARVQRHYVADEAIRDSGARRLLVPAARLGSAILVGAVFANVLGHTRLADLLTRSTIMSTYLGLLTFVGAVLLRAVVDLSVRSRALQSLRVVRARTILISRRLKNFVNVAAALFWIVVVLILTRLFDPLRGAANRVLEQPLNIGDVQLALGDFVAFGLTFWVALLIARFVRFVLEEGVLPAMSLPRGVPATVSKLTGYLIVSLGLMLALAAAGFPLDRLAFMAGAFGLGLGFGLQNLIANFVSGLILLIERPIQVGDTIEFGTRTGRVTRIGIRSSVVRTWDGAEVNVPNGALVSNEVVNWTMSDARRRLSIPVGVSYGTDPAKIPDILLPAATEHEGILEDPAPEVLFNGFGESSLDFELRCWTQSPDWLTFKSEITFAVYERLKAAEVEIPFPQRDLHLRSSDVALGRSGSESLA
jgi:small-conductance mechanosensitive channel